MRTIMCCLILTSLLACKKQKENKLSGRWVYQSTLYDREVTYNPGFKVLHFRKDHSFVEERFQGDSLTGRSKGNWEISNKNIFVRYPLLPYEPEPMHIEKISRRELEIYTQSCQCIEKYKK